MSQHLTELADVTDCRGPTRRDRLSRRGGQSPIASRSVAELCVWHPSLPKKMLGVEDDDIFLSRSVACGPSRLTKQTQQKRSKSTRNNRETWKNTVRVQSGSTLLAGEDAAQPEIDNPRLRYACPLYT